MQELELTEQPLADIFLFLRGPRDSARASADLHMSHELNLKGRYNTIRANSVRWFPTSIPKRRRETTMGLSVSRLLSGLFGKKEMRAYALTRQSHGRS